jgi:hypothetical protein
VQPASGAIDRFDLKADVKTDKFLVDDKVTDAKSFSVTMKLWRKLSSEAWANKKRPVLRVNFNQGPVVYVIDEMTMMELL